LSSDVTPSAEQKTMLYMKNGAVFFLGLKIYIP